MNGLSFCWTSCHSKASCLYSSIEKEEFCLTSLFLKFILIRQNLPKLWFTFMHLADTFIQSDLQCIKVIHLLSVWYAITLSKSKLFAKNTLFVGLEFYSLFCTFKNGLSQLVTRHVGTDDHWVKGHWLLKVLNDIRISRLWTLHFLVNYPFKYFHFITVIQ